MKDKWNINLKKESFLMCILVEALERVEVGGKSPFFTVKTNGFRAKLYFSSLNSYHATPNLLDFFLFGP